MKLTLDENQIKAVNFAIEKKYAVIAAEMGVGKTAIALDVWERTGGKLLVVCPAYLVTNWVREIQKCLSNDIEVFAVKSGKDIKYLKKDIQIAIVSYSLAQKAEHFFDWCDTVVLDEGQELKTMSAKRTQFMHRVIFENSIQRLMILTGTPIKNRVREYYSLIALMNYRPGLDSDFLKKFPEDVTFADRFSHRKEYLLQIRNRYVTVVNWSGFKNVDELKTYLKPNYIAFKLDAAPARFKDVLISEDFDQELWEVFHQAMDSGSGVSPDRKAQAALEKVPFTVQYVKGLIAEGVECVAIYTDHVASCKALAEAFGVEAITGSMNPAKRIQLAEDFQKGKTNYIVATIGSLSTGVDLTRCNNPVLNDPCWVPGSLDQFVGRFRRRTQTKMVLVHRICGSPQDEYIYKVLEEKSATIAAVT